MNFLRCTTNPNVPVDVLLLYEYQQCSGEIKTTGYVDRAGDMFEVCDWADRQPQRVTLFHVCREMELTEQWINGAWSKWITGTLPE